VPAPIRRISTTKTGPPSAERLSIRQPSGAFSSSPSSSGESTPPSSPGSPRIETVMIPGTLRGSCSAARESRGSSMRPRSNTQSPISAKAERSDVSTESSTRQSPSEGLIVTRLPRAETMARS